MGAEAAASAARSAATNCARRFTSMPFHSRVSRSMVLFDAVPACPSARRAEATPSPEAAASVTPAWLALSAKPRNIPSNPPESPSNRPGSPSSRSGSGALRLRAGAFDRAGDLRPEPDGGVRFAVAGASRLEGEPAAPAVRGGRGLRVGARFRRGFGSRTLGFSGIFILSVTSSRAFISSAQSESARQFSRRHEDRRISRECRQLRVHRSISAFDFPYDPEAACRARNLPLPRSEDLAAGSAPPLDIVAAHRETAPAAARSSLFPKPFHWMQFRRRAPLRDRTASSGT